MQFNLVNNKEQVVQFVWGGMALALGFISILGGCLQRLWRVRVLFLCGAFPWYLQAVLAVNGSFAYYVCVCACTRGFACLSVRCVGARALSH